MIPSFFERQHGVIKFVAFLSFIIGLQAFAYGARADEQLPTLSVSGRGEVALAPDMAMISFAVERNAPSAKEALAANNAAMSAVFDAMKTAGIAERDLQTNNFSIQPIYVYPRNNDGTQEPTLTGYRVYNGLTVRVRDLTMVGDILDQSVQLGVNSGGNISFGNDDPSGALNDARIEAMKDAIAKAKTLTEAAGVKVGKVLSISENSNMQRPVPMAMARMEMKIASDSVPVAGGENEYSVDVNVTFAIDQ